MNAYGIEPSSTSSRNRTPLPSGAGSTRSPTVARNGLLSVPISSTAAPVPAGRSMQIVVVSRNVDVDAVLVGQRRLDDLLLHLAVERDGELLPDVVLAQVDQRVLLGQLVERDVQRARSAGGAGSTTVSSVGGAKWCSAAPARGVPIASPIRTSPSPHTLPIRPAATDVAGTVAAVEDADRGDLALAVAAQREPVAGAHRPGEHPDVRDLLAGRAALDLEDGARDRAVGVALAPRAAAR